MNDILFHGGSHIITNPEIREPVRNLDFGKGFYLTSSIQQAERWVKKRLINSGDRGYVNTYEFDADNAFKTLKIKIFETADEEWIDFVIQNRMEDGFLHDYDIVVGPVADDKVYTQLSLFEGGIISKENLIENLLTFRLVDQYLFHTEKALPYLKYLSHYEIKK